MLLFKSIGRVRQIMRIPKISILYQKNNQDEKNRAKEIVKVFMTAGQMMSKPVDVEITSDLRGFKDYMIKTEELPVVIANGQVIFTKHVPPLEFIKQVISTPQDAQKFF